MLACLGGRGELLRLYWPNIDHVQLIDYFRTGMQINEKDGLIWIDETQECSQSYIVDTNIVETVISAFDGIKICQKDFVLIDEDIYVRNILIENNDREEGISPVLVFCAGLISNPENPGGTLFDERTDSMIMYRHGSYIGISSSVKVHKYQIGISPESITSAYMLKGFDRTGMRGGGAFSVKAGHIGMGERAEVTVFLCPEKTLNEAVRSAGKVKIRDAGKMYLDTADYWTNHIKGTRSIDCENEKADFIYRRSLLLFPLLSDKNTGGIIAAPEIDEGFEKCGRYGYCWGRDAVFIARALDKCGLKALSDKFFRWTAAVQDDSGMWHQRYHMDGNLAPSWGMQIDETGSVIHGIYEHFLNTSDMGFLKEMWPVIKKGAGFLEGFMDREEGLPGLSYDLWEERTGRHAYSCAAVYAGLNAAAESAKKLGMENEETDTWIKTARLIKAKTLDKFYKADFNRFIRSIDVKLNPWGEEPGDDRKFIEVNNKGDIRDFTAEDWLIDISLLGLSVPFDMFDVNDEKISETADLIKNELKCNNTGGFFRYQFDSYIGGNPWVIATLWMALYEIKRGDKAAGREYFDSILDTCTGCGFLPEQYDKNTKEPLWIIPLTWSHAMFVLVLFELFDQEA